MLSPVWGMMTFVAMIYLTSFRRNELIVSIENCPWSVVRGIELWVAAI